MSIRLFYDRWPQYNRRLTEIIGGMADEQLAIRPAPDLWPIWATVGHDAAMFQRRGIPASVLLIRNTNGSHNPKEHMDMSDFIAGTKVLASAISAKCRD